MVAREKQAENMAHFFDKIGVPRDIPCVILGKGFKPGVDQELGSPAILVGYYLEKLGYTVDYDIVYDDKPAAYLLAWPEYFNDSDFQDGSVVIDPWRLCPPDEGIAVYHYGDTRDHPFGLQ